MPTRPWREPRVLLVHPPALAPRRDGTWNVDDIRVMAVGLVSLANLLRANGVRCDLLHLGIELARDPGFRLERYVRARGYGLVGLSLHWHKQAATALDLARAVKRETPETFVVAGGYTASCFAEELARAPGVDGVVRGDAEVPLLRLAAELARERPRLAEVPNLVWRDGDALRVNRRAYVADRRALDALDAATLAPLRHRARYRELLVPPGGDRPVHYLVPSRGCVRNCSFCGGGREAQRLLCGRSGVTVQSASATLADLERGVAAGWRTFYLGYDPALHAAHFARLFQEIRRRRLRVELVLWSWGLPGRELVEDLARTFPRASVEVSPETFSERVRRAAKGPCYSNAALHRALAHMASRGIGATLFFGYFLPHERVDELLDSLGEVLALAPRYGRAVAAQYVPYSTDPASPLQRHPERHGMRVLARGLAGYVAHARRAARAGSVENMVLAWPMHLSGPEVLALDRLVRLVNVARASFPASALLLARAAGGEGRLVRAMYRRVASADGPRAGASPRAVARLHSGVAAEVARDPRALRGVVAHELARAGASASASPSNRRTSAS